jgi:hypothetical protein
MAVWGWSAELHVASGLIPATANCNTWWEIKPTPLQGYFINRYVEDLLNSKPRVFVDAVAPLMYFFHDRRSEGFEAFPAIARIIKEHYELVDEIEGVRIYDRVDLPRSLLFYYGEYQMPAL